MKNKGAITFNQIYFPPRQTNQSKEKEKSSILPPVVEEFTNHDEDDNLFKKTDHQKQIVDLANEQAKEKDLKVEIDKFKTPVQKGFEASVMAQTQEAVISQTKL